ncbi:MAG: tRNA (adenosine(37)-N6)-dimethylallyltransferase MiaA [Candidatus Andersenbacteria bacterium]|nr:tRNA (adenosine(37)-N6)-dimethylallyltransferase MiaA [Candidatus Andersenbacteria bacterium]
MSTLKPLIVILGPTASGKTEMGLKLAKKYNGEIINADSRQIYREMNIGTGSPILCHSEHDCHSEFISESIKNISLAVPMSSKLSVTKIGKICGHNQKILKQVQDDNIIIIDSIPHHLFHIKNPNQKFSLSQYKKLAIKTINNIHKRGKIPILIGGTGLYISAIIDNLEIPKAAPNKKIRERLEKHTEKYLFNKLKKVDPKSAKIIGENNKRKLIRAIEVYELTGEAFSRQQIKGESLFNVLQIGIKTDREKLYKKIDSRVDKMIKAGLIKETKKLSKKYSSNLPAMSGIGYLEIGQYLENKIVLEDAAQKIKFRTHQYARRQITWFKRDGRTKWAGNYSEAEKMVKEFLNSSQ